MKRFTKLAFAALVLAGALTFSSSMRAQTTLIYTDGDIFMGFNSAGSTSDYLIDLGSYAQFTNEPVGFHLSLGNFGVDLTSVFGSGWATDNTVQWGVAGTHDFNGGTEISNLYASKAEPSLGTLASPWARQSFSSQTGTSSAIETMAFGAFYGNLSTSDHSNAYIQPKTSGLQWSSWNNGSNSPGSSFNTWVPTIEAPVQPGTGTGITSTRLDLFQILPDNTGTNPPSTYAGTFSIDAAGDISFDVFAAVPEPSTYALLIVGGALAFVVARRQRKAAQANAA